LKNQNLTLFSFQMGHERYINKEKKDRKKVDPSGD
jgi:hypothetical protein